jgi:hypothetical protein
LQVVVVEQQELELKDQVVQVVVDKQDFLDLVMVKQEQKILAVVEEELEHLEQTQEVLVVKEL